MTARLRRCDVYGHSASRGTTRESLGCDVFYGDPLLAIILCQGFTRTLTVDIALCLEK